jgi:uncharacterized alkaline shock family protein YloU
VAVTDESLACGTKLASLVDQVADRLPPERPEHQETCPHCQSTLQEINQLWSHVRELAREEITIPGGIVEQVIHRIVEELRALGRLVPLDAVVPRMVRHALLHGPSGTTRIADRVVAKLIARLVLDLPNVRSLGRAGRAIDVQITGLEVAVDLRLIVSYGSRIPDVAAKVRAAVIRRVEALTGLEVGEVNIAVEGVEVAGAR